MCEEEKKAINELKRKREYFEYQPEGCNWRLSFDDEEVHTIIDVILNLLEKQQNKIEAQEMEHQYDQNMIDDLKGEMVHNWIHKDKIRGLLKSKDVELTGVISYRELEELLEDGYHIPRID